MPDPCNTDLSMQQDVHKLAIEVAVLKVQTENLAKTCEGLEDSVKALTALLNQSRGGWFVLTCVASAGAAVASGLLGLWQFFTK